MRAFCFCRFFPGAYTPGFMLSPTLSAVLDQVFERDVIPLFADHLQERRLKASLLLLLQLRADKREYLVILPGIGRVGFAVMIGFEYKVAG